MNRARLRWGVVGLLLAPAVAYFVWRDTAAAPYLYTAGEYLALGAMSVAVVRRRAEVDRVWWFLLAATAAWVLGDTYWFWYEVTGTEMAWVSFADACYVAQYVFLLAAGVRLVRRTCVERDVDAALDVLAVFVAVLFALWEFTVEPALGQADVPALARGLGIAYPTADVAFVLLVLRVAMMRAARTPSILLLAVAPAISLAADTGYAVAVQVDAYEGLWGAVFDSLWLASIATFALAALHPSMRRVAMAGSGAGDLGAARMGVTCAALAAPVVIGAGAVALGDFDAVEFLLVSAVVSVIATVRFVRLLRSAQRYRFEISTREAYYRAMAQNSSDGVLVLDASGAIKDASSAAAAVLGFDAGFVAGADALSWVHEDDRPRLAAALNRAIHSPGEMYSAEACIRRGDMSWGWYEIRATNLLHEDAVGGVVVNVHDISDRKQAERELAHQAFHDGLTGLANRGLFHDRVEHALARLSRHTGTVVVLFCDIDGFKNVNDSLGHGAGDRLLVEVGTRIAGVVRDGDTVARLGGDEFAVLLDGVDAADRAERLAQRVLDAVQQPVTLDGAGVNIGISIGVAVAGPDALTAEEILRDADTAMYCAKAAGKGRVARFETSMRTAAVDRLSLEGGLRTAASAGELRLRLQPIVELRSGRLTGFEALVRWEHPERGLLAPIAFLSLAEETGTILDIGTWVLGAACEAAAAWDDDTLEIAVNVSGRELDDPTYPERVAAAVHASGLDPHRLVLEVTETTMVEDPDGVAERLSALKRLGLRIAIDDFGTGYSALQYLRRFPVDILKIDRSFVDGVDGDELPAIVRGLIELGRTLDLELLAEGIERPSQVDGLAAGGCEFGQGFLFAKPLEVAAAAALVRSHADLPAAPAPTPA